MHKHTHMHTPSNTCILGVHDMLPHTSTDAQECLRGYLGTLHHLLLDLTYEALFHFMFACVQGVHVSVQAVKLTFKALH